MKKYQVHSKKYRIGVLTIILMVFLGGMFACTNRPAKQESKNPTSAGSAWPGRMQGLSAVLSALMPYAFSRAEFESPKNNAEIKELLGQFVVAAKSVSQHAGEVVMGRDPLVSYGLTRLQSNVQQADQAFSEGHMEFARSVVRESTGLCFQCHSSTELGPRNGFSTVTLEKNFKINMTERAEFYVATRQIDRAIEVLESVLSAPKGVYEDPHETIGSLKKFLALTVRVTKDAPRTVNVLENFVAKNDLPYFLSEDAKEWLKSAKAWRAEGNKIKKGTAVADLKRQANNLIKHAQSIEDVQGDSAAYLDHLRASSLLHEALQKARKDSDLAEIYQLLGRSYTILAELGTWDLPEVYFEACVRAVPGTASAKECFREFEKSVIIGFSGSAGVFIPQEEKARLQELKKIAGY